MTDEPERLPTEPAVAAEPDAASEALAAAKAAALEKVRDASRLRREQESAGAAARRAEGNATRRRRSRADRTDYDHPTTFGDSITEFLAAKGWDGELAVARVLAEWPQTVGEDIAAKATPIGLDDGVLTVQAESTAWATQLRLLEKQLLATIAERFGTGIVTSIHARGPAGPPRQPGAWRVRGGRGPRDTYG